MKNSVSFKISHFHLFHFIFMRNRWIQYTSSEIDYKCKCSAYILWRSNPTTIFNYQKIVYFRCDNLCNFIVHDWNLNFSLCNIAIEREIFLMKNKYYTHKIVIIVLFLLLIFSSFPIFLQHYNDIRSHYSDIVIIVLRRKAWISWISFRAICACAR